MDVDYVQLASVQEEQSAERTGDTREPHQMLCITILALLALFLSKYLGLMDPHPSVGPALPIGTGAITFWSDLQNSVGMMMAADSPDPDSMILNGEDYDWSKSDPDFGPQPSASGVSPLTFSPTNPEGPLLPSLPHPDIPFEGIMADELAVTSTSGGDGDGDGESHDPFKIDSTQGMSSGHKYKQPCIRFLVKKLRCYLYAEGKYPFPEVMGEFYSCYDDDKQCIVTHTMEIDSYKFLLCSEDKPGLKKCAGELESRQPQMPTPDPQTGKFPQNPLYRPDWAGTGCGDLGMHRLFPESSLLQT
jgi:hypothetical protein